MDYKSEITSRVAVLLPVYNAEKYLGEAIESILKQTYPHFDFYIINDGSTDESEKIILSYPDTRIKYIKNESNKGLIYTLNKGLKLIDAEYIARMDADDISMPERIEKQVAFMDNNPEVWVLGTQLHFFGNTDSNSNYPLQHDDIKAQLLYYCSIAHASVMIRRSKFKEYAIFYDADYPHVEDYELWVRIAKMAIFANLPNVLYHCRRNGENISEINRETRVIPGKQICKTVLSPLGIIGSEKVIRLHFELSGNSDILLNSVSELKKYNDELIRRNKLYKIYDERAMERNQAFLWKKLFFKIVPKGMLEIIRYMLISKSVSFSQIRYVLGYYKSKF